nr:MAG TPA: hypothetical protein [Caudoviricetes sp.]
MIYSIGKERFYAKNQENRAESSDADGKKKSGCVCQGFKGYRAVDALRFGAGQLLQQADTGQS